jgi:NADPH-dependent ferric siderophore reductase
LQNWTYDHSFIKLVEGRVAVKFLWHQEATFEAAEGRRVAPQLGLFMPGVRHPCSASPSAAVSQNLLVGDTHEHPWMVAVLPSWQRSAVCIVGLALGEETLVT